MALVILMSFYLDFILVFTLFPLPISTAKFIGEFGSNIVAPLYWRFIEARANIFVLHGLLCFWAKWGVLAVQKAKRGAFAVPIRNFCGFLFIRSSSPISEV